MDKDRIAIEADTATIQLHDRDETYMRQLVANNIKKLVRKQKTLKERPQTAQLKLEYQERNLVKNIRQKIIQNHLLVTEANKGNTRVILYKEDYVKKYKNL
jgi:hypothetical protein